MDKIRRKVRACVIDAFHMYEVSRTKNKTYYITGGLESGVMKINMEALNAELEVIPASSIKIKGQSPYLKCLNKLKKNEVDIACGGIPMHFDRLQYGEVCHFFNAEVRAFTKVPDLVSNFYTFIKPFVYDVWILILTCLLFMSLISYLAQNKRYSLCNQLFSHFATLLQQDPLIEPSEEFSDRSLSLIWSLSTRILAFSYTSVLLAIMMIPNREPAADTAVNLLKSVREGRYKLAIPNALPSLLPHMYYSPISTQKELAEIAIANNWNFTFPTYKMSSLLKDRYAVLAPTIVQKIFAPRNIIIPKDYIYSGPIAIYISKNFRYKKDLFTITYRAWAAGLYEHSSNLYNFRLQLKVKKTALDDTESDIKSLSLEDLKGAFVLLGIGLAFALLILALEIIFKRMQILTNRKRSEKIFKIDNHFNVTGTLH